MATIERHEPGSFCWVELGTTDQNAAKQFYGSLFGWQSMDFPMGPSGIYTIFQLNGQPVAAAYTLSPEMLEMHIPPHWMLYVEVENADATAAKVAPAGGKVLRGPLDAMEFGRMAVIQDPAGAVISIWQSKQHRGIGLEGVPGTLCWADFNSHEPEKATPFYEQVFGWQFSTAENDSSGYLHLNNNGKFIGGVPPMKNAPQKMPSHWLQYYLVENCDASAEKAKSMGARVWMGPMDIEKVGRFAVLSDPQGAAFALFTPAAH